MSDDEQPLLSSEELDAIQGLVEKGEFDQPSAGASDSDWAPVSVVRTEEVLGARQFGLCASARPEVGPAAQDWVWGHSTPSPHQLRRLRSLPDQHGESARRRAQTRLVALCSQP